MSYCARRWPRSSGKCFERVVLQRMLKDLMLERIYTYNHNNLYQWHRTILQTALALERADLIDWSLRLRGAGPGARAGASQHPAAAGHALEAGRRLLGDVLGVSPLPIGRTV